MGRSMPYLLLISLLMPWASLHAQINFQSVNPLQSATNSGTAIGIADMDGDALDDVIRLDQGRILHIDYQRTSGQKFASRGIDTLGDRSQWSICVGDLNNDGINDLFSGGNTEGGKVLLSTAGSAQIHTLDQSHFFMQGSNLHDIDSDGFLDVFACNDNGLNVIWRNVEGSFVPTDWIDFTTRKSSDNSGNYSAIWSDLNGDEISDLYLVKCRDGVKDSADPRRLNVLYKATLNGFEEDTIAGLDIGAQSWSVHAGDYDNDGDFDCLVTNHGDPSMLLQNDGTGVFRDVTSESQVNIGGVPIQGMFADFNNDGFLDIVSTGSLHQFFQNNQDGTFTDMTPYLGPYQINSICLGDLNMDGYLDLLASYPTLVNKSSVIEDQIFFSEGGENGFVTFALTGTQSNTSGIGANLKIYGPWGMQQREIRSGSSYGVMNSLKAHFGIAKAGRVDSLIIRWPGGKIDKHYSLPTNEHYIVEEGGCITPVHSLDVTPASIPCTGDTVWISAQQALSSYSWSVGDIAPSATILSDSEVQLRGTDSSGCTVISKYVHIDFDPQINPSLSVLDDTVLCLGDTTTLLANDKKATSYLWSDGSGDSSLLVSASGSYHVVLETHCGVQTSDTVTFSFKNLESDINGDTIKAGEQASLSAPGEKVYWYQDEDETSLLDSGNVFITPPLEQSTTYFLRIKSPAGIRLFTTGLDTMLLDDNQDQSNAVAGRQSFDVFKEIILRSIIVVTDIEGPREILLRDHRDNIVERVHVDLDSGQNKIFLDWAIPPGHGYQLATNESLNLQVFGHLSPGLFRYKGLISYPIVLSDLMQITHSNLGLQDYFYFFNWEVEYPSPICDSGLIPVAAVVDSTSKTAFPNTGIIQVGPNPFGAYLRVQLEGVHAGVGAELHLYDIVGRLVARADWIGNNQYMFNTTELQNGLYLLYLQHGDGNTRVHAKVLKSCSW